MKLNDLFHLSSRKALTCAAALLTALAILPVNGVYAKYRAEATTKAEVHFKKEFTTSFDFNGMFPSAGKTVTYGQLAQLPDVGLYSVQRVNYYKEGNTQTRYAVTDNVGTHMFGGWCKDAAGTELYDESTPVTDDITLYAKWDDIYSVSFDMNGHEPEIESVYTDKGTNYPLPVDTWSVETSDIIGANKAYTDENDGKRYVFHGWHSTDSTYVYGNTLQINDNSKVIAGWIPVYMVSFDTAGKGENPGYQNVLSGLTIPEPAAPTADGFTLKGWSTEVGSEELYSFNTPVTQDMILHAVWAKNPVVSFDMGGHGDQIPAQTVSIGGTAAKPADPIADHQRFDGWFIDREESPTFDFRIPVKKDITAYAHWTQLYDIVYDIGGVGKNLSGYVAAAGDAVANPGEPSAEGYSFLGWYKSADSDEAFDFTVPVNGNTTVYARWIKVHTVSFDTNGIGNEVATQTIKDGECASNPGTPEADGYQFLGWYLDAEHTVPMLFDQISITQDTVIYAAWEEIPTPPAEPVIYKLKFDLQLDEAANAALSADFPTITQEDNSAFSLPSRAPEYEGYIFKGWATQPRAAFDASGTPYTPEYLWDGSAQTYLAAWDYSANPTVQINTTEATLYAVWELST